VVGEFVANLRDEPVADFAARSTNNTFEALALDSTVVGSADPGSG